MSPSFVHRLRVRYVDCDMQAIVFNAHYYTWMDIAHTELWREAMGPLDELRELGVDFVVAESSARFLAPARFDQDIDIAVRLESLTRSSMSTRHNFTHDGRLLAEGRIRHVCVDAREWTGTPWPEQVRTAFTPWLDPGPV
ncbi:MAG: thioesterase family protein [Marmoricola sp.]